MERIDTKFLILVHSIVNIVIYKMCVEQLVCDYYQTISKRISAYCNSAPLNNCSLMHILIGKVLVHCFMGISRSSTIAACYLMQKKGMNALDALRTLRQHRSIYPNDGFLHQLVQLNTKLEAEGRLVTSSK